MIVELIEFLQKRQRGVRTAGYLALALIVVWSVTGVDHQHGHTWLEKYLPGFWSLFTILAVLVLVFVAGWLGRAGIVTREDYYDK
jgi:4-hydroxybenzoate polyprenyltransferase